MKQIWRNIWIIPCFMLLLGGCGKEAGETITDRSIPVNDVTEFYYTYENINFNAFYQRYRFYREDGKRMFYHETRERPEDYGPTTEEDITESGTIELTEAEWTTFLNLLKDGSVSSRKDNAVSGDSGPWTYIYWTKDKGEYQVFEFPTASERSQFEAYCVALTQRADQT